MNEHFKPSGREVLTDLAVIQDLHGDDLRNLQK
jgi:hypothetical protein